MWFRFDSLGKKFLVPTILLCILLISMLGLFMSWNNRRNISATIDKKADAVATFITKFSANYFAIFDFTDFDNMAKAMKADPDVEFFTILNAQHEPMTTEMKEPSDSSKLIVVQREIKDESGGVLGYVKIGYNKRAIEKATKQNASIVLMGVVIVSALMGLGIALLTQFLIVRRVNFYVERLKDIAMGEGDLTKHLDTDGHDELVELAKWFNTFVSNIRQIVATVQTSVSSVSTSSHELATTAESLTRGAKDQSMQTELVASAMTEMSQTIIEVAKNASDAATASQDAADNAGSGRQVVERAVEAMLRIAETVREATETIGQLGMSSSEIGNIIKVIDEIADQTNLLALNAAIEAARAGEHGRGFAVVADEVRKLAERTGKATKEITGMIEKIQQDTDKSVVSMDAGTAEVETGVALAKEAMSSLEVIVNSSNNGKDMVHRIAVASEEQSTAAEDVSQKMEEILQITQGSAASTTQIKQTSQQLEKLSIDLQKMIGIFKV